MNFEEMVKRAVNAEAKAGLRSSTIVRNLDIGCPRSHRASNNTASKVQTQEIIAKDSHPEKHNVEEVRPTLSRSAEVNKPLNQARKEKKKKRHPKRQNKKK